MQIVIDIPEKAYTYIKREWEVFDYDSPLVHVFNGVKNGVVIPKGHGRLIDAEKLRSKWIFGKPEKEEIDEAPTIIEADKA